MQKMDDQANGTRVTEELDELILEFGLRYDGVEKDRDGESYLRFSFVDRDQNEQSDVADIGRQLMTLLMTSTSQKLKDLMATSKGIVIE